MKNLFNNLFEGVEDVLRDIKQEPSELEVVSRFGQTLHLENLLDNLTEPVVDPVRE